LYEHLSSTCPAWPPPWDTRRLVPIIDEDSLVRDRLYEEKAMILAS